MAEQIATALTPATRPQALRDQIYDRVRTAIVSGELAPGAAIVEAELATRMGASRTPVREALRRLEAEGMIEARGARGMAVRETDQSEAICIFEIREALETLAARRACRNMGPKEVEQLASLASAMQKTVDEPTTFDELGTQFHDHLLQWANGERLKRMLGEVRTDINAWRVRGLKNRDRRVATAREHDAIVAAMRSGDEDAVAEATREHITNAKLAVVSVKENVA